MKGAVPSTEKGEAAVMGTLYLARHGETDYHRHNRILGRRDEGLSECGKRQAERLAEYFSHLKLDAIYSSPFLRCLETAEPVSRRKGLPVVEVEGLVEIDMGLWDGKSLEEIFQDDPERASAWLERPGSVTIPGGENFEAVRRRASESVKKILEDNSGYRDVLVVSHGGPIRTIICEALGLSTDHMFKMRIDLCSVSALSYGEGEYPGNLMVVLVNDTCHLEGGLGA